MFAPLPPHETEWRVGRMKVRAAASSWVNAFPDIWIAGSRDRRSN